MNVRYPAPNAPTIAPMAPPGFGIPDPVMASKTPDPNRPQMSEPKTAEIAEISFALTSE